MLLSVLIRREPGVYICPVALLLKISNRFSVKEIYKLFNLGMGHTTAAQVKFSYILDNEKET